MQTFGKEYAEFLDFDPTKEEGSKTEGIWEFLKLMDLSYIISWNKIPDNFEDADFVYEYKYMVGDVEHKDKYYVYFEGVTTSDQQSNDPWKKYHQEQWITMYRVNITDETRFGKKGSYDKAKKKYEKDIKYEETKENLKTKPKTYQSQDYKDYDKWGFYEVYRGEYRQHFDTKGEPSRGETVQEKYDDDKTRDKFSLVKTNNPNIDVKNKDDSRTIPPFKLGDVIKKYNDEKGTTIVKGFTKPVPEEEPRVAPDREPDYTYTFSDFKYDIYFTLNGQDIIVEAFHVFDSSLTENPIDKDRVKELGSKSLFIYAKGNFHAELPGRWEGIDFDRSVGPAFPSLKITMIKDTPRPNETLKLLPTKNIVEAYYGGQKQMPIPKGGPMFPANPTIDTEFIVLKVEMDTGLWYTYVILNESAKVERAKHRNEPYTKNTQLGKIAYFTVSHSAIPTSFPKKGGDRLYYTDFDALIAGKTPDKIVDQFDDGSYEDYIANDVYAPVSYQQQEVPQIKALGEFTVSGTNVGYAPLYPPQSLEVNFNVNESAVPDQIKNTPAKTAFLNGLDTVIKYLYFYPNVQVRIVGHTSAEGTTKDNEDLSKARAEAVKQYMLKKTVTLEDKNKTVVKLTDKSFAEVSGKGEDGAQREYRPMNDEEKNNEAKKKKYEEDKEAYYTPDRKITLEYINRTR